MTSMTIFDDRLIPSDAAPGSGPPNLADNTFRVDGTWSLANAFLWVRNFANGQPGQRLSPFNIMCHGFYNWAESAELMASTVVGGFGLQLCREGLVPGTIATIAPLVRGKLGDVLIFACGAGSGQAGGSQNGRTFCTELAVQLNCIVYAADRKQVFNYSRAAPAPLNFGEWEGTISRYTPDRQVVPVGSFPSPNPT